MVAIQRLSTVDADFSAKLKTLLAFEAASDEQIERTVAQQVRGAGLLTVSLADVRHAVASKSFTSLLIRSGPSSFMATMSSRNSSSIATSAYPSPASPLPRMVNASRYE